MPLPASLNISFQSPVSGLCLLNLGRFIGPSPFIIDVRDGIALEALLSLFLQFVSQPDGFERYSGFIKGTNEALKKAHIYSSCFKCRFGSFLNSGSKPLNDL